MAIKRGKQTYLFQHPAAVQSFAAIGSKREGEGPLGEYFDTINPDSTFGQKSWERAESRLHHDTVELAVKKAGLSYADLDCLLAGDLLNQCIGATFGVRELGIPYLGIYGACSNMAEGLLLASFLAESGLGHLGVSTASHFCTAERQSAPTHQPVDCHRRRRGGGDRPCCPAARSGRALDPGRSHRHH